MMRARSRRSLAAGACLAAALAAIACQSDDTPDAIPAGPGFQRSPSAFSDPWDLMRAIEGGSFAERAGIREELATAVPKPLPEPLRIPFVSGSEVPSSQQPELARFAELLEAAPQVALRVVGCSDPSGSEALNLRISQQRADAVAAALAELGVAEERFEQVIGRGEDCERQERAVRVEPIRSESPVASAG